MKNGKVEAVYDRDEEPDADLLAALNDAESGVAQYRGQSVTPARDVVREAAIVTQGESTARVLFVRPRAIHSISPNKLLSWTPLVRFAEQTMGSHKFLVGRRYRAPISAAMLATLEQAFDRVKGTSLEGMCDRSDEVAEPTTVERQAFVRTRGGSSVLYVRWHGLWWPVTRYSAYAGRSAEEVEREARSAALVRVNYPKVAIL